MKDKQSLASWNLISRIHFFEQYPNTLVVNPPAEAQLPSSISAWHFYAHAIFQSRSNSYIGAQPPNVEEQESILVFLPKEKKLCNYIFEALQSVSQHGTQLYIVGSKDSGAKSWAKKQVGNWSAFQKTQSGNHCQVLCAEYLANEPRKDSWIEKNLSVTDVTLGKTQLSLSFLPGVFSQDKLDLGTKLLLEKLPSSISGDVLDFGCGSGVISQFLLSTQSERQGSINSMHLCDLNAFAIEASKHTLKRFNASCSFYLDDGIPANLPKVDWIISNPPFHQGKSTNYEIATQFILKAKSHLKANGKVLLVFNQFLPWERLLAEQFKRISVIAQNKSFKVVTAE
ncbi:MULTISPECIES: methyltransferase [Gammaproteobacteria]|uniref:methyltransferase n=1 Tax=Gammaproteobacteria TaxID=1236 RepID=UPI000DD0EDFE|nr:MULTISPECIES: methyltransferase [Gammaproteobacteria]RTE86240.1 class I SAM-dependent methyltransferase [Aliidiomarina sp. B3213]TCZ91591.1 class I SAM-dependent methyltransferase [Lysobacter sp. N42]